MIYDLTNKIEAIWSNSNCDWPVILISVSRHHDGRFFFGIEGSITFLPYEELTFKKGEDPMDFLLLYFEKL